MVAIDLINVIILVCESVVDRRTYCVAGGRGGLCVGELLFEGRKFRGKGIDSYITFYLVKSEVISIEFVMHGCV